MDYHLDHGYDRKDRVRNSATPNPQRKTSAAQLASRRPASQSNKTAAVSMFLPPPPTVVVAVEAKKSSSPSIIIGIKLSKIVRFHLKAKTPKGINAQTQTQSNTDANAKRSNSHALAQPSRGAFVYHSSEAAHVGILFLSADRRCQDELRGDEESP